MLLERRPKGARNPRSDQAYTVIPIVEQLSRVVLRAMDYALESVSGRAAIGVRNPTRVAWGLAPLTGQTPYSIVQPAQPFYSFSPSYSTL